MSIVVDASALVEVLLNTPKGQAIVQAIGSQQMVAPELIVAEVVSALRAHQARKVLPGEMAELAIADLLISPVRTVKMIGLVTTMWELRDNVSAYDGAYVALARELNCTLITTDKRLAAAPINGVSITCIS